MEMLLHSLITAIMVLEAMVVVIHLLFVDLQLLHHEFLLLGLGITSG